MEENKLLTESIAHHKSKYGSVFEIDAIGRDNKPYKGYFRAMTLNDYDLFLSKMKYSDGTLSEIETLITLAKITFFAGDEEMLDLENRFDVVNSYIYRLYEVVDYKVVTSKSIGLNTEITVYDLPATKINIENYKVKLSEKNKASLIKDEEVINCTYYSALFKYPSFTDYKTYVSAYESGNLVSASLELAKMCFISGDKDLINYKKNANIINSAVQHFSKILDTYSSSIKKK